MNAALTFVDAVALWVTCWCAVAGLLAAPEVRDWRTLILSLGLAGVFAAAFAGALAVTVSAAEPMPRWSTWLRIAVAFVAVWLYDFRFGVGRHLLMVRRWLLSSRRRRRAA